jgi:hypothetical protein
MTLHGVVVRHGMDDRVALAAVMMSHRGVNRALDGAMRDPAVPDVNAGPVGDAVVRVVMDPAAVMTGNAAAAAAPDWETDSVTCHASTLLGERASLPRSPGGLAVPRRSGVQQRGPQPAHRFRTDTATAERLPQPARRAG